MNSHFAGDSAHAERFREFRTRYAEQGPGAVTDLEAAEWYQQVAGLLDGDAYEQAAAATVGQLPDHDREVLAERLAGVVTDHGLRSDSDVASSDPRAVAHVLRVIHDCGPSLAELTSGRSGPGARPDSGEGTVVVRSVLAGIAAAGGVQLLAPTHQS